MSFFMVMQETKGDFYMRSPLLHVFSFYDIIGLV